MPALPSQSTGDIMSPRCSTAHVSAMVYTFLQIVTCPLKFFKGSSPKEWFSTLPSPSLDHQAWLKAPSPVGSSSLQYSDGPKLTAPTCLLYRASGVPPRASEPFFFAVLFFPNLEKCYDNCGVFPLCVYLSCMHEA